MTKQQQVASLAAEGQNIGEIAKALFLSENTVKVMAHRMRKAGYPVNFPRRARLLGRVSTMVDRPDLDAGGAISGLVCSLEDEVALWLVNTVPIGGTIADVLRGIVVDAYQEATA